MANTLARLQQKNNSRSCHSDVAKVKIIIFYYFMRFTCIRRVTNRTSINWRQLSNIELTFVHWLQYRSLFGLTMNMAVHVSAAAPDEVFDYKVTLEPGLNTVDIPKLDFYYGSAIHGGLRYETLYSKLCVDTRKISLVTREKYFRNACNSFDTCQSLIFSRVRKNLTKVKSK